MPGATPCARASRICGSPTPAACRSRSRALRERFNLCTVVTASTGPYLQNLDGRWTLDVGGSYGLNVAGFDRYKDWISEVGNASTTWDRCSVRSTRSSSRTSRS